jgi:hypothetical protein
MKSVVPPSNGGALDGLDFCYVYNHDSNHVSDVSEALGCKLKCHSTRWSTIIYFLGVRFLQLDRLFAQPGSSGSRTI